MRKIRVAGARPVLAGLLVAALAAPLACTTNYESKTRVIAPATAAQIPAQAGEGGPGQAVPQNPPPPAGPIVLEAPAARAVVDRTFIVSGQSQTLDAAVEWELRYRGTAIDSGTVRGGEYALAPYQIAITPPSPGKYEIALFDSIGLYGTRGNVVTRHITVK